MKRTKTTIKDVEIGPCLNLSMPEGDRLKVTRKVVFWKWCKSQQYVKWGKLKRSVRNSICRHCEMGKVAKRYGWNPDFLPTNVEERRL